MSDLQELNWALNHNTRALQLADGNLALWSDLMIQRVNILTMILQVTQELSQSRKVA